MSSNQRGEFARVFNDLRGGLVAIQTAKDLERLIEACQETGGKGKLTITLDLAPKGKQNREIHISAKVTAKAPANPDLEERSVFYAQRGQLTRTDPEARDDQPNLTGVPAPDTDETPDEVAKRRAAAGYGRD